MDELISEFLVETRDSLEILDNDLIALEQNPDDEAIIGNVFRVMHTIKGTCGFLGLQRLERIGHAGENILDKVRDKVISITPEIISLILESVDKIKSLLDDLEENEAEPAGDDSDLIGRLNKCAESGGVAVVKPAPAASPVPVPEIKKDPIVVQEKKEAEPVQGDIPRDSEELQALFDSTEPLVSIERTKNETGVGSAPKKPGINDDAPKDSEELQALFDSTEPMVDVGSPASSAVPGDSDELQALFDSTEPLVEVATVKSDDENSGIPGDSEELQALFDATEPLVDTQVNEKIQKEETKKEVVKKPVAKDDNHDEAKKPSSPSAATQSIRVNLDVLEELMQCASELVLTRNQLLQTMRIYGDSPFNTALQRLNQITTDLQEGVMKTRMQPVGNAWSKLPRIIRDLAMELGKKIELRMSGEDTELDRQLLDMIKDPLTHMVRNSADHGLEKTEERIKRGKPEVGLVDLKAYQGGGYIIIEISDDGNGIDPKIIKAKAIEKGLVTESDADGLSESQILQFIFAPGFSTAAAITSVSGRGVGMDVVKSNIEKISGTVEIKSVLGKGSTFTIKIPLTLAIMPILKVSVGGQKFAIPQINVMEVVKTGSKSDYKIEYMNEEPILRLRGHLLPLVILDDILKISKEEEKDISSPKYVVICEIGGYHFGVIVDEVSDTEEIVVKPVSELLKDIDVYAGSTILGDGSVILILDPNGIVRTLGDISGMSLDSKASRRNTEKILQNSNFVLFKAGDDTPKLVPLELLSRLEEIEVSKVEHSHGVPVIQYRGSLMRLASISGEYTKPEKSIQELLVFSGKDNTLGLAVDEIIDIVKCPMNIKLSEKKDGFLGSMIVDGKTCDVIDASYHINRIFGSDEPVKSKYVVSNKNILLIDDSPFFRKFIPPELEEAGFKVEVLDNATEAISKLENKHSFSAIITDLNMPEMTGYEFAEYCQRSSKLKDIPIIALSANNSMDGEGDGMIDMGFAAFISKTDHSGLIDMVKEVIAKKEAMA